MYAHQTGQQNPPRKKRTDATPTSGKGLRRQHDKQPTKGLTRQTVVQQSNLGVSDHFFDHQNATASATYANKRGFVQSVENQGLMHQQHQQHQMQPNAASLSHSMPSLPPPTQQPSHQQQQRRGMNQSAAYHTSATPTAGALQQQHSHHYPPGLQIVSPLGHFQQQNFMMPTPPGQQHVVFTAQQQTMAAGGVQGQRQGGASSAHGMRPGKAGTMMHSQSAKNSSSMFQRGGHVMQGVGSATGNHGANLMVKKPMSLSTKNKNNMNHSSNIAVKSLLSQQLQNAALGKNRGTKHRNQAGLQQSSSLHASALTANAMSLNNTYYGPQQQHQQAFSGVPPTSKSSRSRTQLSQYNQMAVQVAAAPQLGSAEHLPQNGISMAGATASNTQYLTNYNQPSQIQPKSSSRSNTRSQFKPVHHFDSPGQHHSQLQYSNQMRHQQQQQPVRSAKKKSTTPQSRRQGGAIPNQRQTNLSRSPLRQELQLQQDYAQLTNSNRLTRDAQSSILTVTILQAKLQVDTSGFLHTMQVYCKVSLQALGRSLQPVPKSSGLSGDNSNATILESHVKKTKPVTGKEPNWSECFVFDLKSASEYLLELSVWSTNLLVSDSCLGRAFLKFEGSHAQTGSITNWLVLKSASQQEQGEIFVSISKEAIPPSATKSQAELDQEDIKKAQMARNQGRPHSAIDFQPRDLQNTAQSTSNLGGAPYFQHQRAAIPDESEVNSARDDDEASLQQQQYGHHMQQHFHQQQMAGEQQVDSELEVDDGGLESPVDDIVLEEAAAAQEQLLIQNHHYQQQQQFQAESASGGGDFNSEEEGELDEHLQAVGGGPHHSASGNVRGVFQQNQYSYQVQHTGAFRDHQQQARQARKFEDLSAGELSDPDDEGEEGHDGLQESDQSEEYGADEDGDEGFEDGDDDEGDIGEDEITDECGTGVLTPADETDYGRERHFQQAVVLQDRSKHSNMFIQMQQQQNAAEELADLQNDIVEENARLRQEVINIDKIQRKIEAQNKQIRHQKSALKKLQTKLRSKQKRLHSQEEQLVYKRQQIEKESIKVNKSLQKMRRIRQSLDQASQLCNGLHSSEIFSKLRYEASLSQHQGAAPGEGESEDLILAMQAHDFCTNFDKVRHLVEQVANDGVMQGGATGSGDMAHSSGYAGAATVLTTQHQAHNSQSSLQTHEIQSSNAVRKQNAGKAETHEHSQPPYPAGPEFSLGHQNTYQNALQKPTTAAQGKDAYWTHSSIREIQQPPQHSEPRGINTPQQRQSPDNAVVDSNNYRNAATFVSGVGHHGQDRSAPTQKTAGAQQETLLHQALERHSSHTQKNGGGLSGTGTHQSKAGTAVDCRELYEQHLDIELDKVSNATRKAPQNNTATNTTNLEKQQSLNNQEAGTNQSEQAQPGTDDDPLAVARKQQQIYADLINQVSRELSDIHYIKQNLLEQMSAGVSVQGSGNQSREISAQPSGAAQQQMVVLEGQSSLGGMSGGMSNRVQTNGQMQQVVQTGTHSNMTGNPMSLTGPFTQNQQQLLMTDASGIEQHGTPLLMHHTNNQVYTHMSGHLLQQTDGHHNGLNHGQVVAELNTSESIVLADQSRSDVTNTTNVQALQHQQMQFLLEQQEASTLSSGARLQEQHADHTQEGGDEDDKVEVEGYIWESMQRNAQRMAQLKTEKGIQDPVELERELLRGFQTNEVPTGSDVSPTGAAAVVTQDDGKFTQSYIIDSVQQVQQPSGQQDAVASGVQNNQEQEAETGGDDEFEFKFDPDFLNKINANMAMNDQIFERRLDNNQDMNEQAAAQPDQQLLQHHPFMTDEQRSESDHQGYTEQVQQQPPQQMMLLDPLQFQQSVLQGEQIIADHAQQEPGVHQENSSFISTEQVTIVNDDRASEQPAQATSEAEQMRAEDGGPSFIMDYSHNNDLLRPSHGTASNQPSTRVSQTAGQLTVQGAPDHHHQINHIQQHMVHRQDSADQLSQARYRSPPPETSQNRSQPSTLLSQQALSNTVEKVRRDSAVSGGPEQVQATVEIQDDFSPIKIDLTSTPSAAGGTNSQANNMRKDNRLLDPSAQDAQMTANDFEISNRSSVRGPNEQEDEISRLINESYMEGGTNAHNQSVIYKDERVYDQPKKALYGIQPFNESEAKEAKK